MVDLSLGPTLRCQRIQAKQEHAGKIKAFDAVDRRNGHAVGCDVVGLLGPDILGRPSTENALRLRGRNRGCPSAKPLSP